MTDSQSRSKLYSRERRSEILKEQWANGLRKPILHHSIETRQKMSLAYKGRKISDDQKLKLSLARKGMKFSAQHIMNLSVAHKGKPGRKLSEAEKLALSKLKKGVPLSEEHKHKLSLWVRSEEMRQKISATNVALMRGGYKKYTGVDYKGTRMRSSWEVIVAKWLDNKNITWEYEPVVFKLPNGRHYIPDFRLSDLNCFLEVKGWLKQDDVLKMNEFVRAGNQLIYVDDVSKNDLLNVHWGID